MTTTNQFLSIELSRHLSSLVPGFEGHWWWCKYTILKITGMQVVCIDSFYDLEEKQSEVWEKICPAWQVEDVLRNVDRLFPVMERGNAAYWIADHLRGTSLDATYAYQKIEEYLWTILK